MIYENPNPHWDNPGEGMIYPGNFNDDIGHILSSDVRKVTVEYLADNPDARPREILEEIGDKVDTSEGNFHMNLGSEGYDNLLKRAIVNKAESDSRAVTYKLSPWGEYLVEHSKQLNPDNGTKKAPRINGGTQTEGGEGDIEDILEEQPYDASDGFDLDDYLAPARRARDFADQGQVDRAEQILEDNYEDHPIISILGKAYVEGKSQ